MALPADLDIEQALQDYDEKQEKKKSSVKILGKSISDVPCFRDSFINGIVGGIGAGLVRFMFTSHPLKATHFGFGSFILLTLSTFSYCRYDRAKRKWEIELIKQAAERATLTAGTAEDPQRLNLNDMTIEDVVVAVPKKKQRA